MGLLHYNGGWLTSCPHQGACFELFEEPHHTPSLGCLRYDNNSHVGPPTVIFKVISPSSLCRVQYLLMLSWLAPTCISSSWTCSDNVLKDVSILVRDFCTLVVFLRMCLDRSYLMHEFMNGFSWTVHVLCWQGQLSATSDHNLFWSKQVLDLAFYAWGLPCNRGPGDFGSRW